MDMQTLPRWYYTSDGQTRGPVPELELIRLARAGNLTAGEWIVREGEQQWLSAELLIANAHALPIDGSSGVPRPPITAVQGEPPRPGGSAGPALLITLLVVLAVGLAGFAWYMLGPISPILHPSGPPTQSTPAAAPGAAGLPAQEKPADTRSGETAAGEAVPPEPIPAPAQAGGSAKLRCTDELFFAEVALISFDSGLRGV